ncbi:unnamed protein product [Notodromas monacha]|uniref:Uncharacterized protein n=1 Tax=Notodromas monacha TaxID=399045 RepID=A0A7R9BRU6_9CRUS|nr:unnamed protein product [Notodromas monacha]CAG0919458.1 unnamed protein product [Notodromas monacha]
MERLKSDESMKRSSPEMWPESIPGLNAFVAERVRDGGESPIPPWLDDLGESEINLLQAFANKTPRELMTEMRLLLNKAYHLGLEEAKETARGKYLKVLERRSQQ